MIELDCHISEGRLEEYSFGRLEGQSLDELEEHLLWCEPCQDRLRAVSAYIAGFKAAAGRSRRKPRNSWAMRWGAWWAGAKASLLIPAGAMGILLILWGPPAQKPAYGDWVEVRLETRRGIEAPEAPWGRRYRLVIGTAGLPDASHYSVWITDGAGTALWSGTGTSQDDDHAVAEVDAPLREGVYWVHVGVGKESLRQCYLRVKN